MNQDDHSVDTAGLQFFGIVSASISHEIKNALAVINENNGLLEDLIALTKQGRPLDPERLQKLAGTVSEQIRRADTIVKNMNRFAHSADQPVKSVDVNEILDLLLAVSGRFAAMRRIRLDAKPTASPVMLTTSPFHLLNLLWRCLDFAMQAAADERIIELAVQNAAKAVLIRFRGLGGQGKTAPDTFPTDRERTLLRLLDGELTVGPDIKEIILHLPANN